MSPILSNLIDFPKERLVQIIKQQDRRMDRLQESLSEIEKDTTFLYRFAFVIGATAGSFLTFIVMVVWRGCQ